MQQSKRTVASAELEQPLPRLVVTRRVYVTPVLVNTDLGQVRVLLVPLPVKLQAADTAVSLASSTAYVTVSVAKFPGSE